MTVRYIFLALLLSATALQAEEPIIDDAFSSQQLDAFEEVQGNILSPYCPGRLLKDCPSTAARELKFSIKERILEGEIPEEIIENLLEEFGEDMRASPKAEGFGLLAWIAPGLFLLVGIIAILLWVKNQTDDEQV